jgi:glycosyltransferase involved in cell wall biosynthesis
MTDPLVSVVLPVYNQADHIAHVVELYETSLDRLSANHETILVVNGSRDGSLEVCQALAAAYPTVRVIACSAGGWGLAVKAGLDEACGDLLCFTNSARTSPQDLASLLAFALSHPNVVVKANRQVREGWRRKIGTFLYTLECRLLFDLRNGDINGTPKAFPRHFANLLTLDHDDFLIDLEFMAVCRREGYPVREFPIYSSARRFGGSSTTTLRVALKLYWDAYGLSRRLGRRAFSISSPHDEGRFRAELAARPGAMNILPPHAESASLTLGLDVLEPVPDRQ